MLSAAQAPVPDKAAAEKETKATAAPAPKAERKKLTRAERKERTAKLPDQHREWLANVEPIVLPDEVETFLRLDTDAQRDMFIEDFWRRRDIAQGTTNHAFKRDYEERLEFVRSEFGQVSSDRGKLWLLHGQPTARWVVNCNVYQPMDIWYYRYLESFHQHDIYFLFYIPGYQRDYRLWNPLGGALARQELMAKDNIASHGSSGNPIYDCPKDGEVIVAGMMGMENIKERLGVAFEPPKLMTEDVKAMTRSLVIATAGVALLPTELSIQYPAGDG
ncbi:MAG: hypothetical protein QOH21_89, partial [Acidobacteriota bacterium]|nr:hypothetical protein [Acidobacteriota bacterium]